MSKLRYMSVFKVRLLNHIYSQVSYWAPGEGNVNSLPYSCLENSMDRGAWWGTIHGAAKSHTSESVCTQDLLGRKLLNFMVFDMILKIIIGFELCQS